VLYFPLLKVKLGRQSSSDHLLDPSFPIILTRLLILTPLTSLTIFSFLKCYVYDLIVWYFFGSYVIPFMKMANVALTFVIL